MVLRSSDKVRCSLCEPLKVWRKDGVGGPERTLRMCESRPLEKQRLDVQETGKWAGRCSGSHETPL